MPVDTLALQLDAGCSGEMTYPADTDVTHYLRIGAYPSAGGYWASHADMLSPAPDREISQNYRIYAVLLRGTDPQAARRQVDFDEKRDVGARDKDHRSDEQQRNGACKP